MKICPHCKSCNTRKIKPYPYRKYETDLYQCANCLREFTVMTKKGIKAKRINDHWDENYE